LSEKNLPASKLEKLTEKFVRHVLNILEKAKVSPETLSAGVIATQKNISEFIDFVTHNSKEIDELTKWGILVSEGLEERLELLINSLDKKQIDKKVEGEIRNRLRNQYEKYYLQEKLRAIKKKLAELDGAGNTKRETKSEVQKYLERLQKESYPEKVKRVVQEEIDRYEMMSPYSGEASIIKHYID
jgi:ATP-dependent Lon protease